MNIDQLLDACHSNDPTQQVTALHALLDGEAFSAAPNIVDLLASPDATIRSTAARVLGHLGIQHKEQIGPALMNLLRDPEEIVRSSAVDALGLLSYTPALKVVKKLLQTDPDAVVRAAAAETLGDLGDSQALPALELALRDPDEAVRAFAASSLGLLGNSQLLNRLQIYVQAEPALNVKAELYGASYRLGATEALNALLRLLNTANETLAPGILNLLTDLVERNTPATLRADTPIIHTALTSLSQRLPLLRAHTDQLIAQLSKLEPA